MTTVAGPNGRRRTYAPRVPAAQRRTELLDAALHLVVSAGHNAVTMDAVAERVGVSKPVVYGVFANRAELLDALLRREQEAALHQLAAVLPGRLDDRPGAEPGAQLAGVLDGFLQAVLAAPDRWRCIVVPMPDMPVAFHAARQQARSGLLRRAEDVAAAYLGRVGAPAELAPDIVAHTVVTLFEMAARLVLDEPESYRPDRFAAAIRAAAGLAR
ncbi:TetR/AcrR family transcriptional regulator [Pseudonocardia sp. GCM10023141]|uniref:TetR/AcrR family transcriptional regulator n=1 Tax=Pseudonocardia sp. GCM10023141 TaxID=3252653 RepID=UPI003621F364